MYLCHACAELIATQGQSKSIQYDTHVNVDLCTERQYAVIFWSADTIHMLM